VAADDFFSRWAKKADGATADVLQDAPLENAPPRPPPTLDDVAELDTSSDFSPFVAQGVDDVIKRLALKKLFSDPRFNIMDGLDTYIEDYNTFVPMTADMVAELNHAQLLMNPLAHLEQPFMQLVEAPIPKVTEDDDLVIAAGDDEIVEPEVINPDAAEEVAQNVDPEDDVAQVAEVIEPTILPAIDTTLLPTPVCPQSPS
jgi:hypothetical protein